MGHVPPPLPPDDWESPYDRMIADGTCPKCGGEVGSHSDICLRCGYRGDAYEVAGCVLTVLISVGMLVLTALIGIVGRALYLFLLSIGN